MGRIMSNRVDTHMATARVLRRLSPRKRGLTSAQVAIVELADEVIRMEAAADKVLSLAAIGDA